MTPVGSINSLALFLIVGASGEGIVEQIDGVIELNGILVFVEMKW
jgi:restriction system protein